MSGPLFYLSYFYFKEGGRSFLLLVVVVVVLAESFFEKCVMISLITNLPHVSYRD